MDSSDPTDEEVVRAIHESVVQACLQHKKAGTSIVVWRDNQVVWIPAEEIQIPESASEPVTDSSSTAE
jgi:hypothetical protein